MAQHTSDESVLGKIETLVHEEQHLYGQEDLCDHDQVRLEKIQVELDQARIDCVVQRVKAGSLVDKS